MKLLNKLLLLLIMVSPSGFTACYGDDDTDVQPTKEVTELILEKSSVDVEVDDIGTVKITQGGGEYHVFSSNPDIVAVELEGNVVKLRALSRGRTSVIISDKNSQYKELGVVAFYDVFEIETTEINVKMPLGHSKTARIPITKGNGGYEVSVESEIVSATIENDSEIVLVATKEGEATVKLTDSYGLTLDIPVTISTTTIPYDDKELEAIKADDTNRYVFNANNIDGNWYKYMNTTEGDLNLYGWDYYGYMYFKLYFGGDKSAGEKSDGKMVSKLSWSEPEVNESIKFEIIKNDEAKIWAVYSYIKDEKLNFGVVSHKVCKF